MRSSIIVLTFFFISLSVVTASPLLDHAVNTHYDPSITHEFAKRGKCAGIDMRGGGGNPQAPDYYGTTCRTQMRYPSAYTFPPANAVTTVNTVATVDGQVHATGLGVPKGNNTWVCDHILELSILQNVIGSGSRSMCTILNNAHLSKTTLAQRLAPVKQLINHVDNLSYFEYNVEKVKGEVTRKFLSSTLLNKNIVAPELQRPTTDLEWIALDDYLQKTSARTHRVAQSIDQAIRVAAPGATTGVATKWTQYLTHVRTVARTAKADIAREKKRLAQALAQDCARQAAAHAGARNPHLPRRLLARLVDVGNTLLRRAGVKTAPTSSGKQTAASCPAPQKPTKGSTKTTPVRPPVKKPAPIIKTPRKPVTHPIVKSKPRITVPKSVRKAKAKSRRPRRLESSEA